MVEMLYGDSKLARRLCHLLMWTNRETGKWAACIRGIHASLRYGLVYFSGYRVAVYGARVITVTRAIAGMYTSSLGQWTDSTECNGGPDAYGHPIGPFQTILAGPRSVRHARSLGHAYG